LAPSTHIVKTRVNAYAASRNLAIGAFCRADSVNVAHVCRYYGCDDQGMPPPRAAPTAHLSLSRALPFPDHGAAN